MPGTNAGTGRPNYFQCSECRKRKGYPASAIGQQRGRIDRVRLTGRTRKAPIGNAGQRNSTRSRQYVCEDCGHMGWSRHVDLQVLLRRNEKEKLFALKLKTKSGGVLSDAERTYVVQMFTYEPEFFSEIDKAVNEEAYRRMNPLSGKEE